MKKSFLFLHAYLQTSGLIVIDSQTILIYCVDSKCDKGCAKNQ